MKRFAQVLQTVLLCLAGVLATEPMAAVTERLPGVRLEFPDSWVIGPQLQDSVELVHVDLKGIVDARLLFRVEHRTNTEDAIDRARQVLTGSDAQTELFRSDGWPGARQREKMPLPNPRVGPAIPAIRHTAVILVESNLYIVTGWIVDSATAEVMADAVRIEEFMTFYASGDEKFAQRVHSLLRQIAPQTPTSAPTPASGKPITAAPPPRATEGASIASSVPVGRGELSVAVSLWGQNIVVANNRNGAFSSQAGSPLSASLMQGANQPTNGDPSVAWAGSRSFYMASIRRAPNGCSLQIARSDDQGRTFNWNGISPQSCVEPPPNNAALCFPDQEHIAVDDFPGTARSADILFVVWRHFGIIQQNTCTAPLVTGSLVPQLRCSSDGGANWSLPVSIGVNSDLPKVSTDGSSVWIAFLEGNRVMVDRFFAGCGGNSLVRFKGFPRQVATMNPIACPLPGIDRCDQQGLAAPTVASDGWRTAVTYATATSATTDAIATVESYDSGQTWSAPQEVSDNTPARRFMPWSCNASNATNSRIYIGWYDRRAALAAGGTPDLTDYYLTWLGRGINSPNGLVDADRQMSAAPDPQCRSPWTAGGRLGVGDITGCNPAVPPIAGTCSPGACLGPAPAGCSCNNGLMTCNCQIQTGLPPPAACLGSICQGNGIPRYGDYNGLGCSPLLVAAAWASTVNSAGGVTPGINIDITTRTVGIGLRDQLGTAHSGNFIQRVLTRQSVPEFDLFVSSGPPVPTIRHLVRSNHLAGFPWDEQPVVFTLFDERGREERPLGVTVIQSRYPSGAALKAGLELVARMLDPARIPASGPTAPTAVRGQYLALFSRPEASMSFFPMGAIQVKGSRIAATGDPALIQSTRGDNGNFEMLVPEGSDVVHYVRDNDLPNTPWSRAGTVLSALPGEVPIDVAFIQSNIRRAATNTGDLEAIVRIRRPLNRGGDYLAQYSFNSAQNSWRALGVVRAGGKTVPVTGKPALIQSTYGSGRFELLVPNNQNVVHYSNDKQSISWTRRASLYPPFVGPSGPVVAARQVNPAVSLFQSTFGALGNLEAVVWRKNLLTGTSLVDAWFFTPPETWRRIGRVDVGGQVVSRFDGF